ANLEKELFKKGVRQTLHRGGHYLLLVGHDHESKTRDKRQEDLRKVCKAQRLPVSRCRILYGDQIARWISRYSAVAIMPELGKGLPAFVTVEQWRQDRLFQ